MLILLLVVLALPIFIFVVGRVNLDIRNRAAGTNEIGIGFTPGSGSYAPGTAVTVKIALHKLAQRSIIVSGAQAVINVNEKFVINGAACEAPFNGLPFTKINGTAVTVMCAVGAGSQPVSVGTADVAFASLSLTVDSYAQDGTAALAFTSTRATEAGIAGQAPDVSTAGTAANFTISATAASPTTAGGASPTGIYGSDFEIPIGTKDQVGVNIGSAGSNIPKITFSAVLNQTQNNPDLYFRLRVKDELFFRDNPNIPLNPTCDTPGAADRDFYIPMRAQGNIYRPVTSINQPPPGGFVANVDANGWVTLTDVVPDRFYSLILKAPKFRGGLVAEHVNLISGQDNSQIFDFSSNPLEPGDVPDPNNGLAQDCTVNSIDISLIVSRIGSTGTGELEVADVNFDNIVNGNDVAKVVNTLSTKPDDDL